MSVQIRAEHLSHSNTERHHQAYLLYFVASYLFSLLHAFFLLSLVLFCVRSSVFHSFFADISRHFLFIVILCFYSSLWLFHLFIFI
jgi:hypothetical protein